MRHEVVTIHGNECVRGGRGLLGARSPVVKCSESSEVVNRFGCVSPHTVIQWYLN